MRAQRIAVAVTVLCQLAAAAIASAQPGTVSSARRDATVIAVEKAYSTVVNISTERIVARGYRDPFEDLLYQFYGYRREPRTYTSYSLGSGVVVEPGGYIVTNQHVVERASKITVTTTDGTKYAARYINGSAKHDLAVLKIEPKKSLSAIELAADDDLLLGETVIALGDPYGLENTISRGVLSARNRKATWEGEVVFEDMLQTDAAINPGNSGGALINLDGRLIGINTAIVAEAQGIGFAIPVKRVRHMLGVMLSPEKGTGVWFGAKTALREGRIEVVSVERGSPAEAARIAAGDVVMAVDGDEVRDLLSFESRLLNKKAGDVVAISLTRSGKTYRAAVKLAALPKVTGSELAWNKLGLKLQSLTHELAAELGVQPGSGMVVVDVDHAGPAWQTGVRRGLVVARVGGMDIHSDSELAAALAEVAPGDAVTLTLYSSVRRGPFVIQNADDVRLKAR